MPPSPAANPLPPELLEADNLPSLPAVALEVLRLSQDEGSTMEDLARALERDPVLAAKLLKLANSPAFSPGYAITTLHRAAMVLGLKTVKLMALSFSLMGALPHAGTRGGLDLGQFWRRSIVSAVASRSLGERQTRRVGDEAFACGLLGHLGRLVLSQVLPAEYTSVCEQHGGWPSHANEQQSLGFHSGDVTAALLRAWSIPDEVVEPLVWRDAGEATPPAAAKAARQLCAAITMGLQVEEVLCGPTPAESLRLLTETAARLHEWTQQDLDEFLVQLEPEVAQTAEMLSIELPEGTSHEELVNEARLQVLNVSIGIDVELRRATRRFEELEGRNRELHDAAHTDGLTGLANRKHFDGFLARHVQDRLSAGVPRALGLLILDVDRFKSFNDRYGHDAGDEVLRMLGGVLARATRKCDLPARYGGEEFAVVLPQTTPFALQAIAERLRREIEAAMLPYERIDSEGRSITEELRVTASFGGVCVTDFRSRDDTRLLIKLADRNLYRAKDGGRNRVEVPRQVIRLPSR